MVLRNETDYSQAVVGWIR